MSQYSIRDLENISGIKAHTLRIWEQRYGIISPKRTETNIRWYDNHDLRLVLNISLLKNHGVRISHIARMSRDEVSKEVLVRSEGAGLCSDQIQALTLAMLDLDEERFEHVMSRAILQLGFEATMTQVVFPFLTRIGLLWQTGAVNPAQEHFITYLIRQKVIVAIDGQPQTYQPQARKFLLFLPPSEMHELSLLFANYLIRKHGHRVVYLGQDLPFADLSGAVATHQPDAIFSIFTSQPSPDQLPAYLNQLAQAFPKTQILLSGYQLVSNGVSAPAGITIIYKINDLLPHLETPGVQKK